MSTVLWANVLAEGKVVSQEADLDALFRHAERLDSITRVLKLPSFLHLLDTTDQRFNLQDLALPQGMSDTSEWMARDGVWMPAGDAAPWLKAIRAHIVEKDVRFGLISNHQSRVLGEIDEVIAFVEQQPAAEKFNFSVVM